MLPAAAGSIVDHGIYAELLAKHVHNGVVNYAGFKADEARLDQYLALETGRPREPAPGGPVRLLHQRLQCLDHQADPDRLPGGQVHQGPRRPAAVALEERVRDDRRQARSRLDDIEHSILRPQLQGPARALRDRLRLQELPAAHLRALPRRDLGRTAHPGRRPIS